MSFASDTLDHFFLEGLEGVSQTPLGRIGQPGDLASVTVFLASDDSGWITGEVLVASGGQ